MKKKTKKSAAVRAILEPRPVGLDPARTAPFWQGERAEHIVTRRTKLYTKAREEAAARRAGKRAPKAGKVRGGALRSSPGTV